jgi:hypothetical protein
MVSSQNKTPPPKVRGRNEVSCTYRRRIAAVPVVVEPVVVPIPPVAIPVKVTDAEIAIRVAVAYREPPMSPPLEYSQG